MSWVDFVGGISRLTKLFNIVEEQLKNQAEEIRLLRKENAEIRKENATLTERVARLEEGRNTINEQLKSGMERAIASWEIQKLREQLDTEQRKRLPHSDH